MSMFEEGDQEQQIGNIFSIENAGEPFGYYASVQLAKKLAEVPSRTEFLSNLVVDNKQVEWNEAKLAIILSLYNGGPEWTFGILDKLNENLLAGVYDSGVGMANFAQDVKGYLGSLWPPDEFTTVDMLIAGIREKAEDAAYEQDLKDSGIEIIDDNGNSLSGYALQDEIEFEFGDESQGISPEVDKARREAAFYILCIVRFVRVGLTIPERPGGTISNNGDNNTPGIGVLLPRDQL